MTLRRLLRTDGTSEDLPAALTTWAELRQLIDAERIYYVKLRHLGDPLHVLVFDDEGIPKNLPFNVKATELQTVECRQYHMHCKPGTLHKVRGSALVVPFLEVASKEPFGETR